MVCASQKLLPSALYKGGFRS